MLGFSCLFYFFNVLEECTTSANSKVILGFIQFCMAVFHQVVHFNVTEKLCQFVPILLCLNVYVYLVEGFHKSPNMFHHCRC
ncbi:hypothetical protein C8R45DRAFT_973291 [Mycena sanguinolenta]|nr:hypothetical protein C8R45DRAFT_973291 [Mycena sanguinolenta]